ncbi:MAG TPA: PrsW family glutamic-type intramembrane protease [Vicinamibacterales bacterium]|jgi:RsiW-degrading membrane proteinase PrsW (M82 family)|nr:PrsW family glutamic-type intramembrane protease [Vicinamibacterales bacterium]
MADIAAALLPVVGFLIVLYTMDGFKLVPIRSVLATLAGGSCAALVSLWLWHVLGLDGQAGNVATYYDAPLLEETLKASVVIGLMARGRVGFLVDAAVHGFSVGAGFALVENITYLQVFGTAPLALWLVRGLGTAMLHGGTTAIFGIVSRAMRDRFPRHPVSAFLPGLAAAIVIHAGFNALPFPPMILTALIMIVLPLLLLFTFDRSERAIREWMGAGMDLDLEVLQLVTSEHFTVTRFGQYLRELSERFPGVIVADMYCLLRLELELSVHARAMIMARDAGVELKGDEDLEAILAEREHLHRSIGRAGLLALRPLQVTSHRDHWHRELLKQSRTRRK